MSITAAIPVPAGWEMTTLEDVCVKITDGSHNPPKKQAAGKPMLSATNVVGNKVVLGDHRLIDEEDFERENRRTKVSVGDVLLTIVGTIGRTAVVPQGLPPITLQRSVAVIKPCEIDPHFIMHQLQSPKTAAYLQDNAKGTAQRGIYLKSLANTPFLLPPLNEQRRIVDRIDMLFAQLNKGEEALRAVQKQLAHYRQSVLKAAVTGQLTADWRAENAHRLEHGRDLLARIRQTRREAWDGRGKYKEPIEPDTADLPELPEGWVWTTLESVGFVRSGQTPKGVEQMIDPAGTVPWFKVSSMNEPGNETELKTSQWMFSDAGAEAAGLTLLPTGTIVFPKRGGAILTNKKRRLGKRAALDLNTMGFVPAAVQEYLWAFFQGLDLRKIYDGSNVPQINYHDVADVLIALPSSEEEAIVIADIVSAAIEQIEKLGSWCQTELVRSSVLRQSILKDAFAGRLVPQDPADEPAAALLARIKSAAVAKPSRRSRNSP